MTETQASIIHPTADVAESAKIGVGTRVWNQAQVREGAVIGRNCILGKGVYIDANVQIGNRCKVENGASVFQGFSLDDEVFVGPGAMLLNDRWPRATNPDGSLKSPADWTVSKGFVGHAASLGAGVVVLPGITIGRYALIGAGAVVTKDVPDHAVAYGNPARLHGYVCRCGAKLACRADRSNAGRRVSCNVCGFETKIPTGVEPCMKKTQ